MHATVGLVLSGLSMKTFISSFLAFRGLGILGAISAFFIGSTWGVRKSH